jgi:hypothetical protein
MLGNKKGPEGPECDKITKSYPQNYTKNFTLPGKYGIHESSSEVWSLLGVARYRKALVLIYEGFFI